MSKLDTKIITRDGIAWEGEADKLMLPTKAGIIGVLPRHSELVTSLKEGEIRVQSNGEETKFKVRAGVAEIRQGSIAIVLTDIISE